LRAWGIEQVPSLATVVEGPGLADVPWLSTVKDVVLYVDAADLWPSKPKVGCVPLKFHHEGNALCGLIPVTYGKNPKADGESRYDLELNRLAVLYGPWSANGESVGSTGGVEGVGQGLIAPLDDALRYRGQRAYKRVACKNGNVRKDETCPPCIRCTHYVEDLVLLPPYGTRLGKEIHLVDNDPEPTPKCPVCPAEDPVRELRWRFFWTERLETMLPDPVEGPAFFREAKTCETDRKARLAAVPKK
jgi:hypothetical protein